MERCQSSVDWRRLESEWALGPQGFESLPLLFLSGWTMQIIEINKHDWTEQEGLSSTGKRVKAWYARNSDNKVFLFKIPKRYESGFLTYEIWTEIIAYYVGIELGLDIPAISPARCGDDYGVLVENFLEEYHEVLFEAKVFLSQYDVELMHNIDLIKDYLLFLTVDFWNEFKIMLIFDCLIGNNDRHDENWGVCVDDNEELRFAPYYDNASCLMKELNEQGIKEHLNNEQKFNKYIKLSKPPNLYWDGNDPKHYTHYQFMQKLIEKEPETKQIIEEFLQIDYISPVKDIIKEIQALDVPPELKISDNRAKAIIKILEARKEKMRELL